MEITTLERSYYDTATLTVSCRGEDGEIVQETLTLAHKPIDRAVWQQLCAIEEEQSETPADVRVLAFLDLHSRDITRDGRPAELTVDVLSGLNEVLREKIVSAILPNARAAAVAAHLSAPVEPKPKPKRRGGKRSGKGHPRAAPNAAAAHQPGA